MTNELNQLRFKEWEIVRDTYTVVDFLGQGAFGQVYKTRHRFLGLQAMKVFNSNIFSDDEIAEVFNEAWVLSEITHPNVVRIFDANSVKRSGQECYYITMEYVNGQSLDEIYLRSQVALSTTLKLICDICDGLTQAHSQKEPIIHRDIKPQNILIRKDKDVHTAKISDFGLAQHVTANASLLNAAGTLPFMAPEGYWNYVSPASDVFSAGIVFYFMLTKKFPFYIPEHAPTQTRSGLESVLVSSRKKLPDPPSSHIPEITRDIDSIILKALSFKVEDRYQNAMAMADEVRQACNKLAVQKSAKKEAETLLKSALQQGQQYSSLPKAILDMESAFSKDASLIPKYSKTLDQWRKGIVM